MTVCCAKTVAWCAALLVLVASTHAQAVDRYISSRKSTLNIPGISIAVIKDGRVIKSAGYGYANLETRTPAAADTVYEVGSIAKQFTAVAIMILAEERRLSLDDSVRTYFPSAPKNWQPIKIRHLLSHTSGIQNHVAIAGFMDIFRISITGKSIPERDELLNTFYRMPLEFAPVETWSYDNTGYILLGHIIEKVSGRGYWEFLNDRMFKPAGMKATGMNDQSKVVQKRASGYEWTGKVWERRPPLWPHVAFSAGAHVSTVGDFAKWFNFLDSGKILKKTSVDQMLAPARRSDGGPLPVDYGFGWAFGSVNGFRQITHSGGTPGFSTTVHRFPERGLSVILFANHSDRMLEDIALDIAGMYDAKLRLTDTRDTDPELTRRLRDAFSALLAGKADHTQFSASMQKHLSTELGKGLPQWYALHGRLGEFRFVGGERREGLNTRRYRVGLGESRPYFTFGIDADGKIAQLYWW